VIIVEDKLLQSLQNTVKEIGPRKSLLLPLTKDKKVDIEMQTIEVTSTPPRS
jgi:hypothetical protein